MSAVINPNGTLKGKVALVTGASRGIGEAIAARLAMEGARIVVSARTAQEGESRLPGTLSDTVERLKAAGAEAVLVKADLAQASERERLVEAQTRAFDPLLDRFHQRRESLPGVARFLAVQISHDGSLATAFRHA